MYPITCRPQKDRDPGKNNRDPFKKVLDRFLHRNFIAMQKNDRSAKKFHFFPIRGKKCMHFFPMILFPHKFARITNESNFLSYFQLYKRKRNKIYHMEGP